MTEQPTTAAEPAIERPVYLNWSEDKSRHPVQHGWGGDDIYKCEACPEWQGDGIGAGERHSRLHAEARQQDASPFAPLDEANVADVLHSMFYANRKFGDEDRANARMFVNRYRARLAALPPSAPPPRGGTLEP